MKISIEFTTKALKDLKSFSLDIQKRILEEIVELENKPFPFKKIIKKIRGVKFQFYGIEKNMIFVLRFVSGKDVDKILKSIKIIDFPPET